MTVAQRGRLISPFDYALFAEPNQARVLRYGRGRESDGKGPWALMPDEYAVGIRGDYRQTAGGIALAFGRNADGSIDFGKCEAQLAVSGDALRNSSGPAAPLTAGERLDVHGVQFTPADLVRPRNEPPLDSAFVDFDSLYDDAARRGHVGDVEIWRNCNPALYPPLVANYSGSPYGGKADAGTPGSLANLEGPSAGGGAAPAIISRAGLRIEKKAIGADCSSESGCSFEIGVTNVLATPINGPIVVDEIVSVGKADLPAAVLSTTNEPSWICTRSPPFFCTHPEPIKPGERLALNVTVKSFGTGQEGEFKNCASLHTPPDSRQPPTEAVVTRYLSEADDGCANLLGGRRL